jgi:hypothetical protein
MSYFAVLRICLELTLKHVGIENLAVASHRTTESLYLQNFENRRNQIRRFYYNLCSASYEI